MAAKIIIVSPGLVWGPSAAVRRLCFFPDGSEYLKYSPHFHAVYEGGFRQNFPLCDQFVIVLVGKLSVKNYYGQTTLQVIVRDQVWFNRQTGIRAPNVYAWATRKTKR